MMMFDDCTLFAILQNEGSTISIRRISEDKDAQAAINGLFSGLSENYTKDLFPVDFDGKYTPQEDDKEYLVISNFELPTEIKKASRNPLGVEIYKTENGILPKIKALFIGKTYESGETEHFEVALQKFKNDQYITQKRFNLLLSGDTFVQEKRVGIAIGESIEAYYRDGTLAFRSYYYARQIFDLSEYYRIASNTDVQAFIGAKLIHCSDSEEYMKKADTWERKKIASIMDSGLLEKHTAKSIQKKAGEIGVSIQVEKNQIVIPTDKKQRKILLGFLDEEVYKGAFTNTVYQTNSKKRA